MVLYLYRLMYKTIQKQAKPQNLTFAGNTELLCKKEL